MKKLFIGSLFAFLIPFSAFAQNETENLSENCECPLQQSGIDYSDYTWRTRSYSETPVNYTTTRSIMESTELPAGPSGYTTAIGIRGGYTSGITLKHFVNNKAAIEVIVGASRWRGTSLTGLYEWHKKGALEVPQLSWVYGLGARLGFFDGRYYYDGYNGKCKGPNSRLCNGYYDDRTFAAIGVVAIGGLEYKFKDAPLTLGLDLIPYFYFQHYRGNFIDGSFSLRYTFN
jgi:hypothetical protein